VNDHPFARLAVSCPTSEEITTTTEDQYTHAIQRIVSEVASPLYPAYICDSRAVFSLIGQRKLIVSTLSNMLSETP